MADKARRFPDDVIIALGVRAQQIKMVEDKAAELVRGSSLKRLSRGCGLFYWCNVEIGTDESALG